MKYLLLCCTDERLLNAMPESEYDALMNATYAVLKELEASGHLIAAAKLEPVETATTLRMRDGRLAMTDGPFAETKEQLGGYFLVEARDTDEAIRIAARLPPARLGSLEVRAVRPLGRTTE